MKLIIVLLLCILSFVINAKRVIGAWEGHHTTENGERLKSVVIFSDGFQVLTTYNTQTGKFIHSNGGTWKLEGDTMTEKVEFNTDNSELVGKELSFKVIVSDSVLKVIGSEMQFKRIDELSSSSDC